MGDQILDVNNQSFLDITHDEAVSILKYCKTPIMTIRPVGKVTKRYHKQWAAN